ncbi:MAG: hypothetical protein CMH98_22175 [Oceanospirillaceae bacterium]|nr:hypothetical protein [Oceanospirillaceae bacterium]
MELVSADENVEVWQLVEQVTENAERPVEASAKGPVGLRALCCTGSLLLWREELLLGWVSGSGVNSRAAVVVS